MRLTTQIVALQLIAVDADHVAFTYKDYRRERRHRIMRLTPDEFIRRFLLHVLPEGFHRIRHYVFLANGRRAEKIERCRRAIAILAKDAETAPGSCAPGRQPVDRANAPRVCPDCGGILRRIGEVAPARPSAFRCDTS